MQLLSLNKTCRYCHRCNLLIAHQDDLEHLLATIFTERSPVIVANDYLVLGTEDKPDWKRGMQHEFTPQDTFEVLHDFKEAVSFYAALAA